MIRDLAPIDLKFRLAGPVEVDLDGELLSITSPRQEIVLTMLLLESNQVISVSRLIDALWDDAPPQTAKNQVQITISALRGLLGSSGGDVIVTRPPGYLIRIPDNALDLKRFELIAASGAVAAAEQRRPLAIEQLRAALALWRGPALDGVPSAIVQAAATRLNERRLAVLQDCLELELQEGRHQEIIGELMALISEYPLNEMFRAQLMLSLYRSGRQAEALATFRACRRILREDLGLDPGDDLRQMESAILTGDSRLELPAPSPGGGPRSQQGPAQVPRQLPSAIPDFTGREKELATICGLLTPADPAGEMPYVTVVTLTGRGGAGKTALALRAAHMVSDAFPDGQLFAPLHGDTTRTPVDLLGHFLRSFGIPRDTVPAGLEDRAAMYRSWLAGRRMLIVIDDAASISQVTPLLPGAPSCAVIVTTRRQFAGLEGVSQLEVEPLDEQSAIGLLTRATSVERVSADQEAARALVRLCEGMPLALRIVAAKLAARPHWRMDQMVRRLEDEGRRLDELHLDGVSIRATLSISYESLGEDGKRLLRRLGLRGATNFSSWIAAPLLNCSPQVAEGVIDDLVERRLVEVVVAQDEKVHFHLHNLVRIYAMERLAAEESAPDQTAAVRRLLGCWLFLAAESHLRIYGGDFGLLHGMAQRWPLPAETVHLLLHDPIDWFLGEHSALVAAITLAREAALDELCWDLTTTSVTLFESGSHTDDWRGTHETALLAVRDAGNRRGEAALLHSLGALELTWHPAAAALHLKRSLELFDELADVQGRAMALSGLAFGDRIGGRYEASLAHYQGALAGFQDAGVPLGEADVLTNLAQIHVDRQHPDIAEEMLDEALGLCRKLGARRAAAQARCELAELHLRCGHLERAEESFDDVLRTAAEIDDLAGQANALAGRGNTRLRQGKLAQAEADLCAALDAADQCGDRLVRGRVLYALGELNFAAGRDGPAMSRAEEALGVLGKLGSAVVWKARALYLVGRLHERAGRASTAVYVWQSAMELADEADRALVGQLAESLGRLGAGQPHPGQEAGVPSPPPVAAGIPRPF
jgi:DNA-binding SARP family transcriptional activator/tetratricopeptide (TPR) repeat protein